MKLYENLPYHETCSQACVASLRVTILQLTPCLHSLFKTNSEGSFSTFYPSYNILNISRSLRCMIIIVLQKKKSLRMMDF